MKHELAFPLPQSMFTVRRVASVGVASVACIALPDHTASLLAAHLRQTAMEWSGRLVLDLSGVGRFTCAWINTLIEVSKLCHELGGRLVLTGLQRSHREMLESTGLTRYLSVARDQHDAMALLDVELISPWRLALARLLDIPVASPAGVPGRERKAVPAAA